MAVDDGGEAPYGLEQEGLVSREKEELRREILVRGRSGKELGIVIGAQRRLLRQRVQGNQRRGKDHGGGKQVTCAQKAESKKKSPCIHL